MVAVCVRRTFVQGFAVGVNRVRAQAHLIGDLFLC